ncbi:hypothetical protein [Porphyrobacter sp. AAP82]|uniref:hypothetical protein n=1 Tax=Porphyrobacter sp. AAP82 TaxID=1248917 RepID=UPI000300DD35|nr:hypothetical protein [Porphyrobacter sp. AAP82]
MRKTVTRATLAVMLTIAAGATLAQAAPAPSQAGAPPAAAEPAVNEIEVLGERRLEDGEEVFQNLRVLTEPRAFNEPVPRFHGAVCARVAGIDAKAARLVEARINAVADYVGLPRPKEGCKANAVVLILDKPADTFEAVIEKRFGLIGQSQNRDLTMNTIRADLAAGKPLVAWNQTSERNYDGATATDSGGDPAGLGGIGEGLTVMRTTMTGRLRSTIFVAKDVSVVVFDARQLKDVHPIQLADIAALYLLGNPRRNIDFDSLGTSSLLALFRNGPKNSPIEMTDFDRAYLKGVYSLRPNDFSNRLYRTVTAAYEDQCVEEGVPCPPQAKPEG